MKKIKEMGLIKLRMKGFELIQIPMPERGRFYPNQSYGYFLIKRKDKIQKNLDYRIIKKIPNNIYIQQDIKDKKIRLFGKGTGYNGVGPWFDL